MSLRTIAAADARLILEDAAGFAWPITVTSPAGVTAVLRGFTKDISQMIDPETGMLVASRSASVTLPIAALAAAGLPLPVGVPSKASKPWVIQFADTAGMIHTFIVAESRPDLTAGVVVCILEAYALAP